MNKSLVLLILCLIFCIEIKGQTDKSIDIFFDCDIDVIEKNKHNNSQAIQAIKQAIARDETNSINSVCITSSSSPDGNNAYNIALAKRRMDSTIKLLTSDEMTVADSLIFMVSSGVAWDELRELVSSSAIPYRTEVLQMLENNNHNIKSLRQGEPYKYMVKYIFPKLRKSSVTVKYNIAKYSPIIVDSYELVAPKVEIISYSQLLVSPIKKYNTTEFKPLFALKTNLLFDALTLLNVELEIPIGNRWSINGELTFPWWVWDNHKAESRRNRIELINGVIEAKYWWGNRAQRSILTGWYTGVYGGGGVYDFEHNAKGYQGEFMLDVGISGGYAHTINRAKTLRMEYSLGIGYFQTKYRYYEASCYCNGEWHPEQLRSGVLKWFGPTRAKVSLSWLINYKKCL